MSTVAGTTAAAAGRPDGRGYTKRITRQRDRRTNARKGVQLANELRSER